MAELKLPKLPPGVPQAFMELMEKAVSFHPAVARLCGGAAPGLMCCQGMYYSRMKHVQERQGWFYKTAREWEEETCLTRREQDTAKNTLKKKGFIETKLAKVNGVPTLHFRVNFEAILSEFLKEKNTQIDCTEPPNPLHENAKPELTEQPNGNGENVQSLDCTETPNGNGVNAKSYKEQESSFLDSQKTSKAENSSGEANSKPRLSQSERDTWDLRRWREARKSLVPQVGDGHHFLSRERKEQADIEMDRTAAYHAGITIERLQQLLRPFFPDDPYIDKLKIESPLFEQPKPAESEDDIRQTIERSLSKTGSDT